MLKSFHLQGALPPDAPPGTLPPEPLLGAPPPDPHYRLALYCARHVPVSPPIFLAPSGGNLAPALGRPSAAPPLLFRAVQNSAGGAAKSFWRRWRQNSAPVRKCARIAYWNGQKVENFQCCSCVSFWATLCFIKSSIKLWCRCISDATATDVQQWHQ